MWRTIRTVIGLILVGLGPMGLLLPILPGIPLLIAGVALVGTNHPWDRQVIARLRAWRRKWKRSRCVKQPQMLPEQGEEHLHGGVARHERGEERTGSNGGR